MKLPPPERTHEDDASEPPFALNVENTHGLHLSFVKTISSLTVDSIENKNTVFRVITQRYLLVIFVTFIVGCIVLGALTNIGTPVTTPNETSIIIFPSTASSTIGSHSDDLYMANMSPESSTTEVTIGRLYGSNSTLVGWINKTRSGVNRSSISITIIALGCLLMLPLLTVSLISASHRWFHKEAYDSDNNASIDTASSPRSNSSDASSDEYIENPRRSSEAISLGIWPHEFETKRFSAEIPKENKNSNEYTSADLDHYSPAVLDFLTDGTGTLSIEVSTSIERNMMLNRYFKGEEGPFH